nr:hypothetical protein [Tanacetum cinerariifolium]
MNYMPQPMPNPEDILDPTTTINRALILMAKAFKLNYSTPTNNNQRTSSNPYNRQIAQPGMNIGQERQIQLVGGNGRNQFGQYVGQIVGNQNRYNVVHNVGNQVVQNTGNGDTDEIEKVNANCILMANIHQASTSGTQTNKASIYDLDGSAEGRQSVPINKARASVRTNPITISQPHVITEKDVNSYSFGLSSIGVDNTAKTEMPQPRSNTKNDRVPYASKSSCIKKNKVEVEEHHMSLLLSKNQKHMSSKCNNIKLAIRNNKYEVVCAVSNV